MSMRTRFAVAAPIALVIAFVASDAGLAGAQGVHRWVDKDGNVHYSQFPPPGAQPEPRVTPEPRTAAPAPPPVRARPATPPVSQTPPPAAGPAPLAALVPIPLGDPPTEPVARARFLLDNRRWDNEAKAEAARLVGAALKTEPKNAMALTQAARLTYFAGYASGDRYDPKALARAETLVERALAADPKLPEAHVTQGYVFFYRKAYARAKQAALEAEKHRPGDAEAEILLADIANVEKKYDEALIRVQAALRAATTRSQQRRALLELATVYKAKRDFSAADRTYAMIVRLDPDSPWARVNHAAFLTWRQEYERALPLAQEALAIMDFGMGHHVLSRAALGRANQMVRDKKDWVGAGEYYALAAKHDPGSADAHYGLGMSYWARAGATRDRALIDKAGAELQVALKLDPKHAEARRMYDELVRRGWKPS
jgi:tetratricopeptide (TPR) repeat protein